MEPTEIRHWLKLFGWLLSFGAEVWTLVSWFWGGGLEILSALGPPEYAALSAMFGASLLYFTWQLTHSLIQSRRPSVRFTEISEIIQKSVDAVVADVGDTGEAKEEIAISTNTRAIVREMAHHLDDLKIPYPPLEAPTMKKRLDYWRVFLPRLLAASRAGKINEARAIWSKLQKATSNG